MKIKYFLSISVLLTAALVSLPVSAQSEFFINFFGYVQYVPPPPCTPDITSKGHILSGNTVYLYDVDDTDLANPGDTAGDTWVVFRADGCTGFNVNHMWVYFTANDVDGNGRVIPNGSSALRFELLDEDSGNRIWVGQGGGNTVPDVAIQGTAEPFSGAHLSSSYRVAEKTYRIRYYAQTGGVQAGTYVAGMTANFRYY